MSLARITLRVATQLVCSLSHLTPSTVCHAKPPSQRCLPRVVGADSPVTGLQLFAELEWQPSHLSSWPRVYRFVPGSLLISEPVTQEDKGSKELTHSDLSCLNLPRPSPQVSPLISKLCPFQPKPDHHSQGVVMVQNTRSGVRRPWVPAQGLLSQRVFTYLLLRDAAKLPSKKVGPIYSPTSSVRQYPSPSFLYLYQSVWKKQDTTKQRNPLLPCLYFFH